MVSDGTNFSWLFPQKMCQPRFRSESSSNGVQKTGIGWAKRIEIVKELARRSD